jgi:predicted alpha/beta-hydrolase family hydrolase
MNKAADLERLGAIAYPAGDPAAAGGTPRALLVLAHGAGAGQKHPFMVATARGLATRGLDVVTFDFPYMTRGRGAPDRPPVLEQSFRDVIRCTRQASPSSFASPTFRRSAFPC